MELLKGFVIWLGMMAVAIVIVSWLIIGFYAINQHVPTKAECGDGYVSVAGVNVWGWPGRWVCVPGKEVPRGNP
jgi:hypothetical protein